MGVSMLRIDRAKAKWRVKLMHMFEGKRASFSPQLAHFSGSLDSLPLDFSSADASCHS